MPLQPKKDGSNVTAEEKKTMNSAVVTAEMPVVKEEAGVNGNLSDKLCFVAPLGDPSQDDITYFTKPDGTKDKKVEPIIVGYRFKALVDLDIPDVKPGDDLKKNLMSFTGDPSVTRHVKAGEEFDLTKFETGCLISRPEFNGKATGGSIPVSCAYALASKKTSSGAAIKAVTSAVPSIAIRAITGSIKDVAIIPVLEFTVTRDEKTKATRKKRTILPGFEKFEPLCKEFVSTGVRRSGSTGSGAEKRNENAAAFLQIVMAKKAN